LLETGPHVVRMSRSDGGTGLVLLNNGSLVVCVVSPIYGGCITDE